MRPRPLANPPNPWESTAVEYLEAPPLQEVTVFEDRSRSILATNDSPDLGFRYSVNPYRGCQHACAYCYARPGHEYLGFGAGTDFETRIVVKPRAPELLREAFERRSWKGELVMFSGVTDCYQPLEASLRLTRGCLEVCAEYRNPVGIVTKAPLVERDLDVLRELARAARVHVMVSIPFWDADVARALEPTVATPQRRVRTIARLAEAGIPVGVMVAPIVPSLSDEAIPHVLTAASAAGASSAAMVLLRLPGSVRAVFDERVRAALPLRAEKILHRIRETRGGKLYDPRFGARQVGEGHYAQTIQALFAATCRRLGLGEDEVPGGADERGREGPREGEGPREATPATTFRRPPRGQLSLFDPR